MFLRSETSPRFVTMVAAAFFFVAGLALAIVAIAAYGRSVPAAVVGFAMAVALVTYAIRMALAARRGQVPNWIKDLPHIAPL